MAQNGVPGDGGFFRAGDPAVGQRVEDLGGEGEPLGGGGGLLGEAIAVRRSALRVEWVLSEEPIEQVDFSEPASSIHECHLSLAGDAGLPPGALEGGEFVMPVKERLRPRGEGRCHRSSPLSVLRK